MLGPLAVYTPSSLPSSKAPSPVRVGPNSVWTPHPPSRPPPVSGRAHKFAPLPGASVERRRTSLASLLPSRPHSPTSGADDAIVGSQQSIDQEQHSVSAARKLTLSGSAIARSTSHRSRGRAVANNVSRARTSSAQSLGDCTASCAPTSESSSDDIKHFCSIMHILKTYSVLALQSHTNNICTALFSMRAVI